MTAELLQQIDRLSSELEQERVKHAGCGACALGYYEGVKKGDYGWSPSVQEVINLYEKKEQLRIENEQLKAENEKLIGRVDGPSNSSNDPDGYYWGSR